MSEHMEVSGGSADDVEEFVKNVKRATTVLSNLDPEKVVCTMGIAVTTEGVKAFVLGSDMHIAKMLSTLARIVQDGMEKANNPPDHSNEVKH